MILAAGPRNLRQRISCIRNEYDRLSVVALSVVAMSNRIYIAVVIFLWLGTMAWLLVDKVIPPLLVGQPPEYVPSVTQTEENLTVGWHVTWNEKLLGWAVNKVESGIGGVTEVHSRVVLNRLPLEEMTPVWLKPFVSQMGNINMDARSRLEFDPLNRLSAFRTTVRMDEAVEAIRMYGTIENSLLRLTVRIGEFEYPVEQYLSAGTLLGSDLSPQTQLRGLYLGQSWTMPVYSPFHPPNSPLDILQATVEQEELFYWNDQSVKTWVVFYRKEGGAGYFGAKDDYHGKLWVRHDGEVLRQEAKIFDSTLAFIRMNDEEVSKLLRETRSDPFHGNRVLRDNRVRHRRN